MTVGRGEGLGVAIRWRRQIRRARTAHPARRTGRALRTLALAVLLLASVAGVNAQTTATKLALGGSTANLTSGTTRVLTATIQDVNGITVTAGPDSTLSVTFAKTAGAGSVTGLGSVAAVAGVASLTVTGSLAGSVTIAASATGSGGVLAAGTGNPITFTVVAGAVSKLAFGSQPSNTTAGVAISPSVTVQILDAAGNLTASVASVTVAIGTNPGGGTLSGTLVKAAVAGVATFSSVALSINKAGTGYTLTAASGVLTGATSSAFNVTVAAASKVVFGTQPSATTAGLVTTPSVTVQIQDALGNLTSSTASVTVAIGTNPGGGTLSGTLTVVAVAGVATFNDLSINKSGTGYTLTAASTGLTGATSSTFNITAAEAVRVVFGTQPSTRTAGLAITPSVTVRVEDIFGNATGTASVVVAIGTNPGGGTLSGTLTRSAVAGVATFANLSINKVGTGYTLTAASAGLTGATSSAFNITVAAASKVVFGTQPSATTAGLVITPSVTVQIQDSLGNLTSSTASVTLAITTNPGGGTLSGTLTVAAVAGVATFSDLSINKSGTGYKLTATSTGLTLAASSAFNITAAAASSLNFSVQPSNAAAGASISPAVKVQILDSFGNLTASTASVTVAIGTNPGGGTLAGTNPKAAAAGVATFTNLSINKLGTGYTLTAASAGLTGATSSAFNISAGAATKVVISAQPSSTTAGVSISPSVTVLIEDSNSNVTSSVASVTVAIGTNPGGGTLSGTLTVAAVAGVATFSDLSINKSGTGYTLTAASTGLTGATSSAFNITTAAASKLNFGTQPSSRTAGVAISPSVTVRVEDSFGNLTASTASVTVAIGTNPGGGTLSGTLTVAAVAGVATFNDLSINKSGIAYTLTVASSGLTGATSNTFNITAAAAARLSFGTQPSNSLAGVAISPSVTVRIEDTFGNLTASTASVTVAIGTNPGGGTLSGTLTVAAVAGVATFSNLSINKTGTGYSLTAASTGLTGATSSAFNILAAAAAKVVFGTQPSNTTAGVSISPSVTVLIQDSLGNLTTSTAPVTVAIGTNPGGGTLSGTLTVAAVAGVATFNDLSIDKSGIAYTLTAASTGLTGATSSAFTITAAAAVRLNFGTHPSNATAGVAISPSVTVRVEDIFGNATGTASVTVAIGTNPGGGTLSGTLTRAAVAGIATFNDLSINKSGIAYTLTVASSGLTGSTSNTFNITAAAAARLNFGTQPPNSVAGVVISPPVTVRIEDTFGNLTASTASVTVAIGTNPGGGTLSGTLTVAAVAGVATFSTLSINKPGTGYTLTAASAGLTGTTSGTFNITAGAASKLNFGTQPSNATAGVAISPPVTVRIEDTFGNLTASAASVTVAIGTNPGGGTVSGTLTVSAVAGVATFNGLSINKSGTAYTLTAASSGLTGATSVTFNITAAAANHLDFSTQPSSTTAGVAISPSVTVRIEDSFNNLTASTASVTVAIGTNPGGGTLSGTLTHAAVAGVATFNDLSIDKSGIAYTLSAASAGLTGATSGAFNITAAAAHHFLVAAPAQATAGNSFTVTVTAQDSFNNTATGYTGTAHFTSGDGLASLPGDYTFLSSDSGSHTFIDGVSLNTPGSQSMTATDTVASSITGSATVLVVAAGSVADFSITVTDGVVRAFACSTVTYTIVVTNNGLVFVNGATVTDTFPADLTGVSWTCAASSGSSCGVASGSGNIATTVSLSAGGTATYTASGTVARSTNESLSNTASAEVPIGVDDPNPANNSATDTDSLNYWVNNATGSDTNAGTRSAPFATIGAAASIMGNSGTVNVEVGNSGSGSPYAANISVSGAGLDGTASCKTAFQGIASGGQLPLVRGADPAADAGFDVAANHVQIDGFQIENTLVAIYAEAGTAGVIFSNNFLRVPDLAYGVILDTSSGGLVKDNRVEAAETNSFFGIWDYAGSNDTVDGNKVSGHGNAGIRSDFSAGLVVQRNIARGNIIGVDMAAASGPATLYNNTVDGNSYLGIYAESPGGTVTSRNNIVTNNGVGWAWNGAGTVSSNYDDVFGNTSNYSYHGTVAAGGNSIGANPVFVQTTDPTLPTYYQLSSGTPCIDAGIDVGLAYSGPAPDIGAVETP